MAKSTTEAANQKPPKSKLTKIKGDVPYERPFIDPPPENDFEERERDAHEDLVKMANEVDHDPDPLPEKEKDLSGSGQLRAANQLPAKPKIEITKGKLLKGDIIHVEYLRIDGPDSKPAECSEKHTDPPRKEFINAFRALAIHSALIGEFIPLTHVDDLTDAEVAKDFNVTGFTLVGEGEDEGVILTGRKKLSTGKDFGFNLPIIRFNDESEGAYPHLDKLSDSIDLCKRELQIYLSGKHAPDPQGKLFE